MNSLELPAQRRSPQYLSRQQGSTLPWGDIDNQWWLGEGVPLNSMEKSQVHFPFSINNLLLMLMQATLIKYSESYM